MPAYVAGVSVGALSAAFMVAGKIDLGLKTWQDIAKKSSLVYRFNLASLIRAFFWTKSVFTNSPLEKYIVRERIGLQELIYSPIKLDIITTDFQTGECFIFSNKNPEHQQPDLLTKALLASVAMPAVFPPIEYNGHQLFDGGVSEIAPITLAIEEECDTIFVVLTDARSSIKTEKFLNNIYSIIRRSAVIIGWKAAQTDIARSIELSNYRNAYEILKKDILTLLEEQIVEKEKQTELKRGIQSLFDHSVFSFRQMKPFKIFVIEPDAIDSDRVFDQEIILPLLKQGYEKTKQLLREWDLI